MESDIKNRTISFLLAIIFLAPVFLCAKTPVYPDWYTEEGLEEKFPSKTYIREKGEGATKQAAENEAVSYISRYFETETNYSSVSTLNAIQTNGKSNITERIDINSEIRSNMKLFGIKFTEPFYVKKEKKYYVVACINKEEAWLRYENEVASERDTFVSYYEKAMNESDPIIRIKLLGDALLAGNTFREKLVFANILSKTLTQKTFGKDEQLLSSLPSLIKKSSF